MDMDLPFVVGAGLGRTGTHSLKAALLSLGYSDAFHMEEILSGHASSDLWFELAAAERASGAKNDKLALATAQSVLDQGYPATTDYPSCLLYAEFLQLKPNAKVVLSVRSSGKEWRKSVMETIGIIHIPMFKPPFTWMPFFRMFSKSLAPWIFERTGMIKLGSSEVVKLGSMDYENESLGKYDLESCYIQWIETVKSQVPPEQLLIHHPKDGYAPLCQFLGVTVDDCPKEDYPHIGDTKELKNVIRCFELATQIFWPVIGLLLLILAWVVKKVFAGGKASRGQGKMKKN